MTVVEPELMPVRPGHTELWARRAAPTPSTAVREIFAAAARPGIISLAGGNPDVGSLPLDALGESAAAIIAGQGSRALQYGAGQGTEELR